MPAVLRLLKAPVSLAGHDLPAGVAVQPNILLMHTREDIYPDPFAFRPERFLEQPAGTYTWIPFGGGVRRCLGATFAIFEMKTVLRAVADAVETLDPVARASARAAAPSRSSRPATRSSAWRDEQRLRAASHRSRAVAEHRRREPRAALGELASARPAAPTRPPAHAGSAP